jgi:hypothetical protein
VVCVVDHEKVRSGVVTFGGSDETRVDAIAELKMAPTKSADVTELDCESAPPLVGRCC